MKFTMTLTLTQQEHAALLLVLIEQIRNGETQQFIDVLTDNTVTLADLMQRVTDAEMVLC